MYLNRMSLFLACILTLKHDIHWKSNNVQTSQSVAVADTDSFQYNYNAFQIFQITPEKFTSKTT